MDLAQHRKWVREVFEHVTGDHEVLALVVEGTQAVGVQIGDDVRHGEGCLTELGKELTVGVGHPSIDIAHVRARVRNGNGECPGPNSTPSPARKRARSAVMAARSGGWTATTIRCSVAVAYLRRSRASLPATALEPRAARRRTG